jgi:hypothetical protein
MADAAVGVRQPLLIVGELAQEGGDGAARASSVGVSSDGD